MLKLKNRIWLPPVVTKETDGELKSFSVTMLLPPVVTIITGLSGTNGLLVYLIYNHIQGALLLPKGPVVTMSNFGTMGSNFICVTASGILPNCLHNTSTAIRWSTGRCTLVRKLKCMFNSIPIYHTATLLCYSAEGNKEINLVKISLVNGKDFLFVLQYKTHICTMFLQYILWTLLIL